MASIGNLRHSIDTRVCSEEGAITRSLQTVEKKANNAANASPLGIKSDQTPSREGRQAQARSKGAIECGDKRERWRRL